MQTWKQTQVSVFHLCFDSLLPQSVSWSHTHRCDLRQQSESEERRVRGSVPNICRNAEDGHGGSCFWWLPSDITASCNRAIYMSGSLTFLSGMVECVEADRRNGLCSWWSSGITRRKLKKPAVDPQIVHIRDKMLQSTVKMGSNFSSLTINQFVQCDTTMNKLYISSEQRVQHIKFTRKYKVKLYLK